eukprot:scaffold27608_cov71-Phaeocystis_antarctica.AAC.2
MRARGAYVVIHLSVPAHDHAESSTVAARTQIIDVRRALEVPSVTQLRRPRPAGFRRGATSHRPKVVASQPADPARRASTPRQGSIGWKKNLGRLKKNFKIFLTHFLLPALTAQGVR